MNDQESQIKNFSQTWPKPSKNNPIIIIGTGGIVKDAHLPAYKKAGFNVHGLYDVDTHTFRSAENGEYVSMSCCYEFFDPLNAPEDIVSRKDELFNIMKIKGVNGYPHTL